MKFTVSKTEIVKALSSTLGVVEKRQALPILSNVLLTVEDNSISITATDLESEVQTCLIYTSPSPRDKRQSRMPSSA